MAQTKKKQAAKPNNGLTARQQRFVNEYLVTLNATQAAIRAGYSEKTARAIGCENLTKPDIAAAIAARREKLEEEILVTQRDVLAGLLNEAKAEGEGTSHGARVSAWAHLGKHLGMFVEKVEHSGSIGATFIIEE